MGNGFHNGRSYVDVVKRKHGPHSSDNGVTAEDSENAMEIQPNMALYKNLKCCLMRELRAYETLQNLGSILKADGLGECFIHYIGGFFVLLEWSSEKAAKEDLRRVSKVKINNITHYIKIFEDVIRSSLIKLNFNMDGPVSEEDTKSSQESQSSEETSFEVEFDVEFGDQNYKDDEEIFDQHGLMEGLFGDDLETMVAAGSCSSSGKIL
uniref:Uncharacterized protein n=1 Tax=Tanacetum cinerariifolium TaxID=118510 RepID=A0A6L2MUG4_TANCI|nr:hypothetical protein [Tanacetum cinerariifolium]